MSKLVSSIFKIGRLLDTVEMCSKGSGAKRVRNVTVGKKIKGLYK